MQSCKKRGKFWGLGLIVGACFTGTTFATTVPDSPAADNGNTDALGLYCLGTVANCGGSSTAASVGVTSDSSSAESELPIFAALPDNDPSGATNPARFYSWAKSSNAASVAPIVTCSAATVTRDFRSTSVQLPHDGGSCAITITPQANGDPYAGVKYTGTLTRTGNIYRLTNGTVCGSPYSACSSGTPTNAPIDLHFSKQVESYSTEIELK